ncbi:hypothetical protein MMMDOFMJ_3444 [Methylobacterium gnaphalii]|nr:hypothetical protein MMMDOFMJ_3444 [Methylobacterium gnaphalii]
MCRKLRSAAVPASPAVGLDSVARSSVRGHSTDIGGSTARVPTTVRVGSTDIAVTSTEPLGRGPHARAFSSLRHPLSSSPCRLYLVVLRAERLSILWIQGRAAVLPLDDVVDIEADTAVAAASATSAPLAVPAGAALHLQNPGPVLGRKKLRICLLWRWARRPGVEHLQPWSECAEPSHALRSASTETAATMSNGPLHCPSPAKGSSRSCRAQLRL